jgi:hypothetical protein
VSEYGLFYDDGHYGRFEPPADVSGMTSPVRCTMCTLVYDLGKITEYSRYLDCTVWKCPGCRVTVDDRPAGWGAHHYVELDANGFRRQR